MTTREVFTKFAQLEIKASRKLEIIARVVPDNKTYDLPSWVPDWSTEARSHRFLYLPNAPEFQFSAAAQSKAIVAFNMDSLTFKGVNISCIELLGPRPSMKTRSDIENGLTTLYNWWKLIVGIEETSSAEHEAFVRTLTCDKISQEYLGLSTKSEFFLGLLGCVGLMFSNAKLIDSGSFMLNYWILFLDHEAEATPSESRSTVESVSIAIMETWVIFIYAIIWDRRFFISSSKPWALHRKRSERATSYASHLVVVTQSF